MWHGGGHLVAEYELLISLVSEVSKQIEKQKKRRERGRSSLIHVKEKESKGREEGIF